MSAQANAASRQGMLFGDPLEGLDTDEMGYRGPVACSAAGITYRQLDYWARTGLLQPSIRAARGSGSQRLYSFRDILVLKVVKKLLDAGVSLQQVRVAVSSLQNRGVDDLASITLMSDGASVYECTSTDEVIDLLQGGQGVFGIAVGRVWREVEGSLAELPLERSEPAFVDELAERRGPQLSASSHASSTCVWGPAIAPGPHTYQAASAACATNAGREDVSRCRRPPDP